MPSRRGLASVCTPDRSKMTISRQKKRLPYRQSVFYQVCSLGSAMPCSNSILPFPSQIIVCHSSSQALVSPSCLRFALLANTPAKLDTVAPSAALRLRLLSSTLSCSSRSMSSSTFSATAGNGNSAGKKSSILGLPLAPSVPEFLSADPAVPSASSLFHLSEYDSQEPPASDDPKHPGYSPKPTILRRSRPVHRSHFSYVTPLPVSFPYAVKPHQVRRRKVPGEAVGDGSAVKDGAPSKAAEKANVETPQQDVMNVEDFLATMEPDLSFPVKPVGQDVPAAYTSETRKEALGTPQLAGLSKQALDDLLPNLEVGDAFEHLQSGSSGSSDEAKAKREELVSFLAGHTVAYREPKDGKKGFAPWSLCYGGHQFGSWASQLGDGRAISILTTPTKWPKYEHDVYYPPVAELQLKGAGRTPYSRFADGLAVLRSSVREYLGSEAMAALGIPTSRALSLVHLPDVEVQRERMETGAIVCRVAPSWLRIGCFELPWSRDQWDTLLDLVKYAGHEVFGFGKEGINLGDEPEDKSLAAKVLRETSRRNARTFAGWQACGFMHGVLNTDNISISGLTIDYGP